MHAKSGGSCGDPPDFLFIPAACRSRKDLPRSAGGETGRGTRATVRGTQKTEPRARARGAGRGRRGHGHGRRRRRRVRGRGCGARGAGRGCGTRKTRAWGAGRKTRNTWTRTRARAQAQAQGHGVQDAGRRTQNAERRTQNTGYWPRAAEHGKRGHEVQKTEDAGTGCRTQNTGYWPRAAEHGKRGHGAQETGHRRRGTSPRAWTAARLHTPARPRNNLPGPFTAGRHPPRAAATCRAYESESRRCRRARRTCCCRAALRPT